MANYNEITGTSTMWTRCYQVIIENPYGGLQKPVRFSEENVINLEGKTMINNQGQFGILFNPTKVVQLRDPSTNTLTGETFTHQELYDMLHSLYIQSAMERDSNT